MNFRITTLLFSFAMLSVTAFAGAPSMSVVPAANNAVYNVFYKNTSAQNVKVSILSDNKLIFSETISNVSSFKRPYNFSQLPQGQYTIVLEDSNGKQVQEVNYSISKIESFIRVVKVSNSTDKYILNVSNNGSERVSVKIMNGTTLLHEQKIEVTGTFGLIYNLSQLKNIKGDITFEVTTDSGKTETVAF